MARYLTPERVLDRPAERPGLRTQNLELGAPGFLLPIERSLMSSSDRKPLSPLTTPSPREDIENVAKGLKSPPPHTGGLERGRVREGERKGGRERKYFCPHLYGLGLFCPKPGGPSDGKCMHCLIDFNAGRQIL